MTDANLLLGRLPADRLLAVERPVSVATIREHFATVLGDPLGLDAGAAAAAVLRVGNDLMASAIRMVSLNRGEDPRDFALFAFGGAGPLHACALAAELGIPRVLIPPRPGITNAIGCAVSDARHDLVQTLNRSLHELSSDAAEVAAVLQAQHQAGRAKFAAEPLPVHAVEVRHSADMQYRGQTHLLRVDLPTATPTRDQLNALFADAYYERFAVRLDEIGALLVNLNTTVVGRREPIDPAALMARDETLDPHAALLETRRAWFDGWRDVPVYQRERLVPGLTLRGPAVIQQLDATTIVENDCALRVDPYGNLLIDINAVDPES